MEANVLNFNYIAHHCVKKGAKPRVRLCPAKIPDVA